LALEQRRNPEAALDREVPDWRQINNDPQWIGWLSGTHLYSDRARQFHLDDAVASGNVHRVAAFFRDFLAQNATAARPAPALGASQQWGSRVSPRDKPVYRRDDIVRASREYQKGKISEADYRCLSYDFVAAAKEGRIIDSPMPKGKSPNG
jgi:hypothetical protein